MEENKYLKIGSILAFLGFAGVSCWATTESLHLLLPSWPIVICWIVTIGFFIIASIGSKMIVDSLNQNIYLEKRGAKLLFGIIILLVFWIICSMPTNTHTFFYRSSINDVAMQDVATTKKYLQDLRDNVKVENNIKNKVTQLESEVSAAVTALENEIDNIANPGFGNRAKEHLSKIAQALSVSNIPTLSYKGTSPNQRKLLKEQYRSMIYDDLLPKRIEEIKRNNQNAQANVYIPEAERHIRNLEIAFQELANMKATGVVDNSKIAQISAILSQSYTTIKNYADLINLTDEDKTAYLSNNQVTNTHKMVSVIDVWKDFIKGSYAGRGFIFWVIISMLVDIAAFIFFDIAFKKREY